MHVIKFGGTSVANFSKIVKCIDTMQRVSSKSFIVVSAQSKVTDKLVQILHNILLPDGNSDRNSNASIASDIFHIVDSIYNELQTDKARVISCDIINKSKARILELSKLLRHSWNDALSAELMSYGEVISSALYTSCCVDKSIKATFIDARKVIITDDNYKMASPDIVKIKDAVSKINTQEYDYFILGGFIGSDSESGNVTTLGRGGSDYSSALIAEALGCSNLHILTDVNGIYDGHPNEIEYAKLIPEISIQQAIELCTFGGNIICPTTFKPALRSFIEITVANSHDIDGGSTIIRHEKCKSKKNVTAITMRPEQSLITVNSINMIQTSGFLSKIFNIMSKYDVLVDLVITSESNIAFTINNPSPDAVSEMELYNIIINELKLIPGVNISVDGNAALIAVIVDDAMKIMDKIAVIFQEINKVDRVKLASYGANNNMLFFMVGNDSVEQAYRITYDILLRG